MTTPAPELETINRQRIRNGVEPLPASFAQRLKEAAEQQEAIRVVERRILDEEANQ